MKILVAIKRVVDYNVRIQIKPDNTGVVTDGVKMSMNPFDEIALEEALRIRDRGDASEVTVISIGNKDVQLQLRTGLAMGADKAIHITSDDPIQPLTAARALLSVVEREQPGLVITGKQAIDDDCNQTGQMLAALWQRPQATFASEVTLTDTTATVTREVDAGLETIEVDLPALITTDLRLNEPRFVKLPDIMKAKRKPMETIALNDLNITSGNHIQNGEMHPPEQREKGIIVNDVQQLVSKLKERGLI